MKVEQIKEMNIRQELTQLQRKIKWMVTHGYPVEVHLINRYNHITENEIITEKWNEEER